MNDSPSATTVRLGATPVGAATRFEVWAPSAGSVDVVIDGTAHPMATVEVEPGTVTWTATVDGVGHGDRYRYRLDGGDELPDPASRFQPDGVHGASAVVDPTRFEWTDGDWRGVQLDDAVLYELHVGTFTPEGTFDAAVGQLDRLADLGVTVVEPMPVNAFPGRRNWGYDGVFVSAAQESYGGPEGLARFVDAAHARGIGVVLDVVYNHLGPEGNVLPRFGPYFTDTFTTPWGPAVNVADAGSDAVRRLFVESAVGWVRDLHVDGFRLDAVQAIVDPTASPFVAELTEAVHAAGRQAGRTSLVILESSANDPRMVRPPPSGWGADAVWNDDVHHAIRVALTGGRDGYYADYVGVDDLVACLEGRWLFDGRLSPFRGRRHGAPALDVDHRRFVVFTSNHDHVGNTPTGDRMLADAGPGDPRRRLAAAAVLLSPYTPMLFMGEEYGETASFPYFVDHGDAGLVEATRRGRREEFADHGWTGEVADPGDPDTFGRAVLDPTLADRPGHDGLLALHRRLIEIRREHRILTDPAAAMTVEVVDRRAVVVRRERVDDGGSVVASELVLNFSDRPVTIGGTDDDAGEMVLDTSEATWGTTPMETTPAHVAPWSARLVFVG